MSERRTVAVGWAFVLAQVVLLVLLVVTPGGTGWPTPPAVRIGARIAFIGGLVILAIASLNLGRSLTPTPVPRDAGQLKSGGLYRFVRHPIYSGVMLTVVGMVAASGSFVRLAFGCSLIAFFNVKARWEERQLLVSYPGYSDYRRLTPRFVPRLRITR